MVQRRRRAALSIALGAFTSSVTSSGDARADTSAPARRLDLRWTAAPGCPDRAWAARALAGLLGSRGAAVHGAATADVVLTPSREGRVEAHITTSGSAGRSDRQFEGETCGSVAQAAALVVAIAVDPVGVADRAHRDATHDHGTRVGVGIAGVGDIGSLPTPTLGAGVTALVERGRVEASVSGAAFLPRIELTGPRAGTGGEIGLFTGSVRGCFAALVAGPLRLATCAAAELGVTTGRGIEIREPTQSRGLWGAAFAGVTFSQATNAPLRPWISLDAGAPFLRPTYVIEGFGPVFRASPVIARACLGVAWIFP